MSDLHHSKSDVFKSIGRDRKLKEEILERVKERAARPAAPPTGDESLAPGARPTDLGPGPRPTDDELELLAPTPVGAGPSDVDRADELLRGGFLEDEALEAIIQVVGRPVIRILNDDVVDEDIPTETLRDQLRPHAGAIRTVVRSVGRIELTGHRRLPWVGTGWVVDDDIMITNRHVASEFGLFTGATFDFLPGVFGGPIEARVDFLEEHGNPGKEEFRIDEILHIEPEGGPDLAFVRVEWAEENARRPKLELWEEPLDTDRQVIVVGYPAKDTRTNIPAEMDRIFGSIYNVKRLAPGFVIGASVQAGLLTHDCTTLGGNSGSAVLDLESGKAVALHFAGREQQANFAVMAPVIRSRLNELKAGVSVTGLGGIPSNEVAEETPAIEELAERDGYDRDFLDVRVELPGMTAEMRNDLAPVAGRGDGELKYTHYSVFMSQQRRVAYYAVVNIDGNQLHGIPRGSDRWFFDPRIDRGHQVGNELYKSNPLDRGHLARRLDPAWGRTRSIAERGVEDSFFYTNCAPQHLALNRNLWLGLEDYILNNSGDFDLKVTVFSGPVFREDDREYRGVQVPNEFWKVVAMVRPDDEEDAGELSVTGYVLSQRSLIDDLEFVFGEHQGFQVTLEYIEELTGLDFRDLKSADPLARRSEEEAVRLGGTRRGRRLLSFRDIVL